MVLDILMILEKGIWFGFAALGFAVLFNVPQRTLIIIWMLGAAGGMTKLLLMQANIGIVVATLAGAALIGVLRCLLLTINMPLLWYFPSLL
jgi:uncharacterized membrane protein YjjB (DUF3815 family)